MLKFILKSWQKKPLSVILIIIGYFIAILFLSIGISIVQMNEEVFADKNLGNWEDNVIVSVSADSDVQFNYEVLVSLMKKLAVYGEVQALNFGEIKLKHGSNSDSFPIVPILSLERPEWHMPVMGGRYFKDTDFFNQTNGILIGKVVAKKLHIGKEDAPLIRSNGKKYIVIGTIGREYRETQWDDVVYIPINSIPQETINQINNKESRAWRNGKLDVTFLLRKKTTVNEVEIEKSIKKVLNEDSVEVRFSNPGSVDRSSVENSKLLTGAISGILLLISLINIINLSVFWIMERKKSLAIMSSIGATPMMIVCSIIFEMLMMVVIATGLSLLTHQILWSVFKDFLIQKEIFVNVSYWNFLIVMGIGLICGLISSLIPVSQSLKIEPAEALKND